MTKTRIRSKIAIGAAALNMEGLTCPERKITLNGNAASLDLSNGGFHRLKQKR